MENKTGRLCRIVLVTALLGATLSACRSSPPQEEPVVITFAIPATVTMFNKANFRELVEAFNQANPDVEVQLQAISTEEVRKVGDFYSDILLNEEWGIDVFFTFSSSTERLANTGQILNLQPLLEADPSWELDDFYPSILTEFKYDNDLWGIPTEFVPLVTFYNKDLFDEAGVAYPQTGWTRDDFLAAAMALGAVLSKDDFAFAGGSKAAIPFIYAHKGILMDQDQNCILDNPLTTEALKWYIELALVHEVSPTLARVELYEPDISTDSTDVRWGIITIISDDVTLGEGIRRVMEADAWMNVAAQSGDAALWFDSLWEAGGRLQTPWRFRWGAAPLPRDAVEIAMFNTAGCFVTAHSPHPREALRWIQYLTRRRVNIAGIPARRSLARSAAFQAVLPQEIDKPALDSLLAQMEQGQPLHSAIQGWAARCLGEVLIDVYERGEDVETALMKAQQRFSDN